jgi:hypothetical protein
MAKNEPKTPSTIPSALPVGSGNQIDRVREWIRKEERDTASIMDHQARQLGRDD